MSHVSAIDVEIQDLDALAVACEAAGLELVRDQATYKWYGTHVGDWPIPKGFTKADLGKCEHAIRVPGNPRAYEIGVVRRRDGRPGFQLIWDFWGGGNGLQAKAGKDCLRLRHEYNATVAIRKAHRQGLRTNLIRKADGTPQKLQVYR